MELFVTLKRHDAVSADINQASDIPNERVPNFLMTNMINMQSLLKLAPFTVITFINVEHAPRMVLGGVMTHFLFQYSEQTLQT